MALIAFIIIIAIILSKYKLGYKVSINSTDIGYIDSQEKINEYIEEVINSNIDKNIAFVDVENMPVLNLELINKNIDKKENTIKEEIAKQVNIQYTNYAITVNGENKVYISNMEEAQNIVDEIKKEYSETYTKKIGILQVYSSDYNEINPIETSEAKSQICKAIKSYKNSNSVKVAKNTKSSNINGVKLSISPVKGIITSRYGRRSSPGGIGSTNHKGIDIAAKTGTAIYATANGTVTYCGHKGAMGKLVVINHGNGVETYYAHCSKINVSKGDKVKAGDIIAAVGRTGSATGSHLHLEIHINGIVVNPQKYIY